MRAATAPFITTCARRVANKPARILVLVLIMAAWGSSIGSRHAGASPVVLIEDNRELIIAGQNCNLFPIQCFPEFHENHTPPTDFADWDTASVTSPNLGSLAQAQVSSVSPLLMSGSGFGSSWADVQWHDIDTVFDIVFDVVDPTSVALSGSLFSYVQSDQSIARLTGPGGVLYFAQTVGNNDTVTLDFNGILGVGRHQLEVLSDVNYSHRWATWDFELSISPHAVPEPGTALLMSIGLAGMATMRRRPRER